jgi:hypothetical protein
MSTISRLWSPILTYTLVEQTVHLGVGVNTKDETWKTHLWLAKPRPIAIESDLIVIQHHCARCGRDFVTNTSWDSGSAVFVSAISFYQLSDAVTMRWLSDACPGRRLSSDEEDRRRRIAELKVVNDEGLVVSMSHRPRDASTTRPKRRRGTVTAGGRTF